LVDEPRAGVPGGAGYHASRVPFYEYRRPDGTILEVMQKMTDPPLTEDPETGVPLQRIFHPIAVHFKGKGFYNTDYGTKKRAREKAETESSSKKDDAKSSDAKSETKASETTTKSDTAASASSSSSSGDGAKSTKSSKD
jgi:predicted nucleic acid-binding Zn ribbon protein